MDGKKEYTIVINGVKESIDAVSALNKQLNDLDARIETLNKKVVNVEVAQTNISTTTQTSSTSRGNNTAVLTEEAAVQKEINKLKAEGISLDAKIAAAQTEVYQKVDATKQLYKETIADQKAMAAQERLYADTYSNTMVGIKEKLADLKSVHFTTDLSTDEFKQQTAEINTLTEKLKELEKEYGVYSRDVGNYANGVREGLKGLAIQVGDTTKEFDNAKQALKELKKERDTLAVKKDMGLISDEEAKRLEQLIPTVAQLQSAIQDAGKPMDALMDSMQSVMALAQTGKGFAAFFGFDDDEVERSIQKLVALQNAMQGLQTLQKQMQSQEGIGSWLTKGNDAIDKLVSSIFGVGKASKTATVATKALGTALKALGIGAIVAGVTTLIDLLERWSNKQKKAAEEAEEAAEKVKKSVDDQRQAYVNASAQYMNTASRLSHLRSEYLTTNDALRKTNIIKEAAAEFKKLGIEVKSASDAQRIFVKDGDKVIEMLKLQGDAAAIAALRMEAFKKSFERALENNNDVNYAYYSASYNKDVVALDEQLSKVNDRLNKLKGELGVGVSDIGKGVSKSIEKANKEITDLELRLMQDGLNKKLRQLDEEERQTINKLKENGRKTGIEIQKVQRLYNQLREKEIKDYLSNLQKSVNEAAKNISNIQFDIDLKAIDNQVDELKNKFDELSQNVPSVNTLATKLDLDEMIGDKNAMRAIRDYGSDMATMYAYANKSITSILSQSFKERLKESDKYYDETIEALKENISQQSKLNEDAINERKKQQKEAEGERYSIQMSGLTKTRYDIKAAMDAIEKQYKVSGLEGVEAIKDSNKEIYELYNELFANNVANNANIETAKKEHKAKMTQIDDEYNNSIKKNELDTQSEKTAIQEKYYDVQLSNYRDFQSKLNDEISRNPVKSEGWEIVNIPQTKRNYQEIIEASKTALKAIEKDKEKLENDFKNGLINNEAYNTTKNSLKDVEKEIKNGIASTQEESKNLVGDFVSSIQPYLQAVTDSLSSVLNAVWTAQDAAYEREKERLQEQLDFVQDKYDKMSELADEYSSRIKEAEGLIATAQGDARDALLDRYNVELQAERRAIMEKKKAAKEEEKLKAKADKLDKEQREKQKQRDIIQALINTSMAISMASINTWPMPAIAMMAAAAVAGAAQVAAIASQHYATGGVIEGKSHAHGGVKALVGGNYPVELEGQEYIIRKKSTTPNVGVLDFINKSERKLKLEDFIDFFTTGKIKSTIISSSPRTKFADGGIMPSLRNDITINDRMIKAIEDYSNRPVYVAVTEIQDKMESVNYVKTLAGLNPEY